MTDGLAGYDALATIAVKDLESARRFYEDTLGFELIRTEGQNAAIFRSGKGELLVYQSQFAGTNKATAATWTVGDAEQVARDLAAKGVKFEHYDMPGTTRKGDVHIFGRLKNAWFKDPDGNILSIVST